MEPQGRVFVSYDGISYNGASLPNPGRPGMHVCCYSEAVGRWKDASYLSQRANTNVKCRLGTCETDFAYCWTY